MREAAATTHDERCHERNATDGQGFASLFDKREQLGGVGEFHAQLIDRGAFQRGVPTSRVVSVSPLQRRSRDSSRSSS